MDMRRRIILKRRLREARKLAPVAFGIVIGAGCFFLVDRTIEQSFTRQRIAATIAPVSYFRNCDEARAAGVVPLRRGEPGYNRRLDADGDGVACEPYPR
jgi:hypothetical protein